MQNKILLSGLFLTFISSSTFAHTKIIQNRDLTPRSISAGLKRPPCGNIARTPNPAQHEAGATIEVEWAETRNHPGRYEFYFSPANDENFTLLKTIEDTQDGTTDLPHLYKTDLTLPDVKCEECTIQLVQVMMDNPSQPKNYYSCADISLR